MSNHAAEIRAENAGLSVLRRGRRFVEFNNGDGSKRWVGTIDPLHVTGTETEIDATWLTDAGAWQWRMGEGDFQAHARDVFNVGNLVEWRIGDEWVIFDPQSINWINQDNSRQQIAIKQAITGQVDDATLSFPEGYGAGRHFEYIAHPNRLIKNITIDNLLDLPDPTVSGIIHFEAEFTLSTSSGVDFYLDDVKWIKENKVRVKTANKIEFRDAATGTQILWFADAPIATDANDETISCEYEVRRQGGPASLFITVRVPREWILSAAFPIKIDPQLSLQPDGAAGKDTQLNPANTDKHYGSDQSNSGGTNWLIEFDVSSIDAGSTCDDATLSIWNRFTKTSNRELDWHELLVANEDWAEGTSADPGTGLSTWDNKIEDTDAWAGSVGAETSGTDYDTDVIGTTNYTANDAAGTECTATLVPGDVEDWFGGVANYGLWGDNSLGLQLPGMWMSDNATAGLRPKLVINYTEAEEGYTIVAAQGSYTLTGQTVSPLADRKIAAAQGSYSLSGQATALLRGFLVSAAQGSYTLTGQNTGLIADRIISAGQGSYTLSGQDIDLLRGFILAAAQGTYTLSGQDLGLLVARLLTAAQGSYTLTGIAVTLDYSAITGYTIVADQGSYNLTGQSAGLLADRTLSAAQGVYVLTGQDADILLGHLIAAEQGGYTLTGQTAGLIADRLLGAAQGSYVISGQSIGILFVLFPNPDNVTFVQFEDRRTFMKQTDPDIVPYQDRRKRG